jgi:hypothetical protein
MTTNSHGTQARFYTNPKRDYRALSKRNIFRTEAAGNFETYIVFIYIKETFV